MNYEKQEKMRDTVLQAIEEITGVTPQPWQTEAVLAMTYGNVDSLFRPLGKSLVQSMLEKQRPYIRATPNNYKTLLGIPLKLEIRQPEFPDSSIIRTESLYGMNLVARPSHKMFGLIPSVAIYDECPRDMVMSKKQRNRLLASAGLLKPHKNTITLKQFKKRYLK